MDHFCICSEKLNRKRFSKSFDQYLCEKCGSSQFLYCENKSEKCLKEYQYGGNNRKYGEKSYLYGKQLRWAHQELIKREWNGKRVLEIGCFNGFFLSELQKKGAEVYGFDVNSDAIEVGRELFGLGNRLDVSISKIADLESFDEILMIDVLEHLDEPSEFLIQMKSLLKKNGSLIIAGPTVERLFHDKSDFPPHHKWWFSRNGLISMLNMHQLHVLTILIQRDGLLFLRNLIGRLINGINKKEFYGDNRNTSFSNNIKIFKYIGKLSSIFGGLIFNFFGISYCSTIIIATANGYEND